VDDGRTGLVVLLLGDPHLLEGGQGSQDGAADPDGVLTLRRSNDLEREREMGLNSEQPLHIHNIYFKSISLGTF